MRPLPALLALGGTALAARSRLRRSRRIGLDGRTALITGGSSGLGLAVARRMAEAGAAVAICARGEEAVEGATRELRSSGAQALGLTCDVADRDAVEAMVADVEGRLGDVDVLVNAAGVMDLGAIDAAEHDTFAEMLDVMFWGVVNMTLAVLPGMRARRSGRIATITSIAGRVSAPHLVPYSCAKHAAHAFSQGLRAELADEGVLVTTVVPGLMHTGSHRAAQVRGGRRAEYAWFALSGANRLIATAPERAAERVIDGVVHGDPVVTIGLDAKAVTRLEGLAPETATRMLGVMARLLPDTAGAPSRREPGWELETPLTRSPLTIAGRDAAADLQAHRPGPAEPAPDEGRSSAGEEET